jgi:hypothetical protein
MERFYGTRINNTTFIEKVKVCVVTALVGIIAANPTEVVKIRLQEQRNNSNYKGCIDCYKKIWMQDGLKGFWSGVLPNLTRNMIDSPTEIAVYFHAKQIILRNKWMKDNTLLHSLCGLVNYMNYF